MFGQNPKRPIEKGDGQTLQVVEIFPTLQGEGPYTGWPSVFVRLGGCNLACRFCDTEFENFNPMTLPDLLAQVDQLAGGIRNLVVITGGEPFRQPIEPLCTELLKKGYKVQIETNGTLYRPIPPAVDIICSPKNESGPNKKNGGYAPIRPDLAERVNAYKFIISAHMPEYHDVGLQVNAPVYVQPMDEHDEVKNAENLAHTVNLAIKKGYRLSLQTHKLLNLP
ncbi:radical SAM protein [bacterium]|nr:radical SAM protein [bacterium]